jgi:hypothetical protein
MQINVSPLWAEGAGMHTYSNTQSSVVLCLLAALVVGGLITNGFALMSHVGCHNSCAAKI